MINSILRWLIDLIGYIWTEVVKVEQRFGLNDAISEQIYALHLAVWDFQIAYRNKHDKA